MIVLDTNVVSEAMKATPAPQVHDWLNAQAIDTLYLSSVTLAELLFGIAALPSGRRQVQLGAALDELLRLFHNRVLPFDTEAARQYAQIAARAREAGRGLPTPDGYIAAIAAARGYIVASRDTAPFDAAGVACINPWNSP